MRIPGTPFSDTPVPKLKRMTPELVRALERLARMDLEHEPPLDDACGQVLDAYRQLAYREVPRQ